MGCDCVYQADVPCGSPEPSSASVRQPTKLDAGRWQPYNAKVKDENEEVTAAVSAWDVTAEVAGVVGGGVVGLAGYTAQSVQDSWTAALTSLLSPFTRQATRPDGPPAEWLCGRCGRTLRGG